MSKRLIIALLLALGAAMIGLRQPHHNTPSAGAPSHGSSAAPSASVPEQNQPAGTLARNRSATPSVTAPPRNPPATQDISRLTRQQVVVSYLQQHQRLPDYYIRKNQARQQGWQPSQGNLCQALPGRAIGGDRFSNREKQLPERAGRQWYEADINYQCGRRGSDRLLYSSDGLMFVTTDHYQRFVQVGK